MNHDTPRTTSTTPASQILPSRTDTLGGLTPLAWSGQGKQNTTAGPKLALRDDAKANSRLTQKLAEDAPAHLKQNQLDTKAMMNGVFSGALTANETSVLERSLAHREMALAAALRDGVLDQKENDSLNTLAGNFDKLLERLSTNDQTSRESDPTRWEIAGDLAQNLRQQKLMFKGSTDGSLDAAELARVLKSQAQLHHTLSVALQDGRLSNSERADIEAARDATNTLRFDLRHNQDASPPDTDTPQPSLDKNMIQGLLKASDFFAKPADSGWSESMSALLNGKLELGRRELFNLSWKMDLRLALAEGDGTALKELIERAQHETQRRGLFDLSLRLEDNINQTADTGKILDLMKAELAQCQAFDKKWQANPDFASGFQEIMERQQFVQAVAIYHALEESETPTPNAAGSIDAEEQSRRSAFNDNFLASLERWTLHRNDDRSKLDKLDPPENILNTLQAAATEFARRQQQNVASSSSDQASV